MDVFAAFATDEKLEIEGRWVKLADAEFKIARSNNKHFNRIFAREAGKNKAILDGKGDAAEEVAERIIIETMAKTILLDWKNVSKSGEQVPYSEAAARELLAIKDFRRFVQSQADDFEAFKVQQTEADAKN